MESQVLILSIPHFLIGATLRPQLEAHEVLQRERRCEWRSRLKLLSSPDRFMATLATSQF